MRANASIEVTPAHGTMLGAVEDPTFINGHADGRLSPTLRPRAELRDSIHASAPATRDVLVVDRNGTADSVEPQAFKVLTRLNIVLDLGERMAQITAARHLQQVAGAAAASRALYRRRAW